MKMWNLSDLTDAEMNFCIGRHQMVKNYKMKVLNHRTLNNYKKNIHK